MKTRADTPPRRPYPIQHSTFSIQHSDTHGIIRRMPTDRIVVLGALLCAVLAFGACSQAPARPTPPPVPTAVPFTPLPEAILNGAGRTVTLGYLVSDQQGAWLADTVRFGDGAITTLTPDDGLIWCGDAAGQVEGALLGAQGRRYALVSV